jgi:ribose 5-phosphate isomerase B
MKIACGFDHAGFPLKDATLAAVRAAGHEPIDLGTDSTDPVDYPDYALAVGRAVVAGEADRGIIVCGSGAGVAVAAAKIPGIRACCIHDHYTAHQGVEHDDVNVLCMGARVIGPATAEDATARQGAGDRARRPGRGDLAAAHMLSGAWTPSRSRARAIVRFAATERPSRNDSVSAGCAPTIWQSR